MTRDDPMTRSGARWCEEHARWECASKKNHHASAVRGTAYCRHCAGVSTDVAKAKGRANQLVWSVLDADQLDDVEWPDPVRAVMLSLRVAMMRQRYYAGLMQRQVRSDRAHGLVGPTYAAGRDGARVETSEAVRALARLEAEERKLVGYFAKMAHDMGVDERRLELEQAQAGQVVTAVGAGLDAAELDAGQRDAFVQAFMTALGRPVELEQAGDVEAGEA